MLKTIQGTFKSGEVQLGESVAGLPEGPVLVTFLAQSTADSGSPSLTSEQVADLRGRLAAWEEDWNAPGMEAYDKGQPGIAGHTGSLTPSGTVALLAQPQART